MPDYRQRTRRAAIAHGIDPDIFERQIGAESNFNPNANSGKALGIAQFTPETAASMGVDVADPESSLNGGARLMARYVKEYGNYKDALVAYNAGPGRVGKPLYAETEAYIGKILGGGGGGATGGSATTTTPQGSHLEDGGTKTVTDTVPTFDQAGFAQAMRSAIVGRSLAQQGQQQNNPLFLSGLLGTAAPNRQDYAGTTTQNRKIDLPDVRVPNAPTEQGGAGGKQRQLAEVIAEANLIDRAKVPYQLGGGHGAAAARGSKVQPLDCSGAVSRVLGINPRVSGDFEKWGRPGRGKGVTVYANSKHVLMEINGHFWGTSGDNPGGGAGWIKRSKISKSYLAGFTARHSARL